MCLLTSRRIHVSSSNLWPLIPRSWKKCCIRTPKQRRPTLRSVKRKRLIVLFWQTVWRGFTSFSLPGYCGKYARLQQIQAYKKTKERSIAATSSGRSAPNAASGGLEGRGDREISVNVQWLQQETKLYNSSLYLMHLWRLGCWHESHSGSLHVEQGSNA